MGWQRGESQNPDILVQSTLHSPKIIMSIERERESDRVLPPLMGYSIFNLAWCQWAYGGGKDDGRRGFTLQVRDGDEDRVIILLQAGSSAQGREILPVMGVCARGEGVRGATLPRRRHWITDREETSFASFCPPSHGMGLLGRPGGKKLLPFCVHGPLLPLLSSWCWLRDMRWTVMTTPRCPLASTISIRRTWFLSHGVCSLYAFTVRS